MKIKLSRLKSLIKECIILETEMRSVSYMSPKKLVTLLSEYGVDENIVEAEGINFNKMVENMSRVLNNMARGYASTSVLMPEKDFIDNIYDVLERVKNNKREVPDFISRLLNKNFHVKLADSLKMTIKGRSEKEPDEDIVMGVMKNLLTAIEGTDGRPGLSRLADLFSMYDYSAGSAMSNKLLGDITKFKNTISTDKRSGKLEFDDRFVRRGGTSKEVASSLLKTKVD